MGRARQSAQNDEARGAPARGHEGFTLQLALVDAIPVLEFCAAMLVVAARFQSFLFAVGALCCALAGCCKVAWKLVLALHGRDVARLGQHFMQRMLTGFALMAAGVLVGSVDFGQLWARVTAFPAAACFGLALLCMLLLCILRSTLDQHAARSNWIEQFVNIAMQTALLAGILLY